MHRIIVLLIPTLLLATTTTTAVHATDTCPTGGVPDACFDGLCTPYLGVPPEYGGDVCCDPTAGRCVPPGPEGCVDETRSYVCHHGLVDAASGEVQCMFGTYQINAGDPPPAADEQPLCCNDNGCTVVVAGCEGGGGWIGYCYGDLLIMDDGTAHCFQEDC